MLSKLARARGGVRPHWGFTENFTAPGGAHLGLHHLPPSPRCRHHTPGAYRPHARTFPNALRIYASPRRARLAGGASARFPASLRQPAHMGDALSPSFSPPEQPEWNHRHSRGLRRFWQVPLHCQAPRACSRSQHLGVFTGSTPSPPGDITGAGAARGAGITVMPQ